MINILCIFIVFFGFLKSQNAMVVIIMTNLTKAVIRGATCFCFVSLASVRPSIGGQTIVLSENAF